MKKKSRPAPVSPKVPEERSPFEIEHDPDVCPVHQFRCMCCDEVFENEEGVTWPTFCSDVTDVVICQDCAIQVVKVTLPTVWHFAKKGMTE